MNTLKRKMSAYTHFFKIFLFTLKCLALVAAFLMTIGFIDPLSSRTMSLIVLLLIALMVHNAEMELTEPDGEADTT